MSQNISYHGSVRVPSIEHAAEVIGLMGFKINQLRSLTNAAIIPPLPGNDPVFKIKAPSIEALRTCQASIQSSSDHFDQVRLEKRNIIMQREFIMLTLRVSKTQVKIIIGYKGSNILEIEKLFNVYIKSPDRSTLIAKKEPIFVISGLQKNVDDCITYIKLILYMYKEPIQMTFEEFKSIEVLLNNHPNTMIDLKSMKQILKYEKFTNNFVPAPDEEKFYCLLCFTYNVKKAKVFPCGDIVCCGNCIVRLYRDPNSRCYFDDCKCKIDQFEILNYWQK